MGYYTAFSLTAEGLRDNDLPRLSRELTRMSVFDYTDTEHSDCWTAYAKWYDWDKDMLLLSTRFPKAVFCLHGDGEETEDMWDAYFKNGRTQFCHAEISYPPYDEASLTDGGVRVDPFAHYSYESGLDNCVQKEACLNE